MDDSRRWSLRAALGFAAVAWSATSAWELGGTILGHRARFMDGVTAADLAAFAPIELLTMAGTAAVAGALVGGPAWAVLVERWSWSSVRRRGALAGAAAGALVTPVWVTLFALVRGGPDALQFPTGLLLLLLISVVGGFLTVPIGAVTGYLLGRWRARDVAPA